MKLLIFALVLWPSLALALNLEPPTHFVITSAPGVMPATFSWTAPVDSKTPEGYILEIKCTTGDHRIRKWTALTHKTLSFSGSSCTAQAYSYIYTHRTRTLEISPASNSCTFTSANGSTYSPSGSCQDTPPSAQNLIAYNGNPLVYNDNSLVYNP